MQYNKLICILGGTKTVSKVDIGEAGGRRLGQLNTVSTLLTTTTARLDSAWSRLLAAYGLRRRHASAGTPPQLLQSSPALPTGSGTPETGPVWRSRAPAADRLQEEHLR